MTRTAIISAIIVFGALATAAVMGKSTIFPTRAVSSEGQPATISTDELQQKVKDLPAREVKELN